MPKPKPFVFNDSSSKNSHGFIIPTDGIDLTRFKKNPIMLDSHYNSNRAVLGKWEDIKSDKGKLTGVPVFDSDDEDVAKIEGKVERGFITSCSMGVRFHREDMKYIDGVLILEKCQLYEVSIVAIPSNENCVRLYAAESGELLKEEEVSQLCLSAIPVESQEIKPENKTETDMKIKLTSAAFLALGMAATETEIEEAELNAKIIALNAGKTAAELKLSTRLEAEAAAELTAITAKVDAKIASGALSAEKKDKYIQLGVANPELLDDVLDGLPKKATLADQVQAPASTDVKTAEDFQKLSVDAQLKFKQQSPAQYLEIFTKK